MIINENNKNTILKGTVKRGFNQNPNELASNFFTPNIKQTEKDKITVSPTKQNKINVSNGQLKNTINNLNRLK